MNFKQWVNLTESIPDTSGLDLVGYNCRQISPQSDPHFGKIKTLYDDTKITEKFVKRYMELLVSEETYYEFIGIYGDDPSEEIGRAHV